MDEGRYREAEARLWASVGASPREHHVRLAGTGTSVRVQEIGDGPPVLFVHGASTSGLSWATLAARLRGFRCLLLDRPGTGLSEPLPGRLTVERVIAVAEAMPSDVLDALGLPSAHLVGTSYGGFVTLRAAAAHADRFGRMVQFSWPAGAHVEHVPSFMRMNSVPGLGRLMAALPPSERSVRLLFRQLGHGPSLADGRITPADIDAFLALLRDTPTLRNELALGRVVIGPLRGLEPRLLPDDVLGRITTPTLFLWGEKDPFGGPTTARDVSARVPGARLEVLPAAGHAPWLDELDRCAAGTAAFLGA